MPTRSMRSRVPSRITNALRTATAIALRKLRGERGEGLDRFVDVAEHRGRADAVPGGEVGVGLALAQVRHRQHRLLTDRETPPAGPTPLRRWPSASDSVTRAWLDTDNPAG